MSIFSNNRKTPQWNSNNFTFAKQIFEIWMDEILYSPQMYFIVPKTQLSSILSRDTLKYRGKKNLRVLWLLVWNSLPDSVKLGTLLKKCKLRFLCHIPNFYKDVLFSCNYVHHFIIHHKRMFFIFLYFWFWPIKSILKRSIVSSLVQVFKYLLI